MAMQMSAFAAPQQQSGSSGVQITSLEKNATSTVGSGNVAAAGNLTPFGDIGVGCGINWKADTSYGGKQVVRLRNQRELTPRVRRTSSWLQRLWPG